MWVGVENGRKPITVLFILNMVKRKDCKKKKKKKKKSISSQIPSLNQIKFRNSIQIIKNKRIGFNCSFTRTDKILSMGIFNLFYLKKNCFAGLGETA